MPPIVKALRVAGFASALSFMAATVGAKEITFGYVAAGMQFPFNVAVVKGFQAAAKEAGVKTIILDGKTSVERQGNAIDDLIAQKVDGIAVLPIDGLVAQGWVDRVTARNIPFVSVATEIGDPQNRPIKDVYGSFQSGTAIRAAVLAGKFSAFIAAVGTAELTKNDQAGAYGRCRAVELTVQGFAIDCLDPKGVCRG
ncbi:ABC-type sugar transport system substrate-binding protein [Paraburkholderia sp. WSM4175]|uniref:substrate-binding domain-containing protein n=1 Tax=Paraburkholderia sp. WSM4175 TaxID=2991072 RepID=UPI003D248487